MLTKRALIIDDDPILRMMIRLFLEQHNRFKVCELDSGQNAIESFQKFGPDIVLLDLEMPDPNGFEIFKALKNQFPQSRVPICFLTGSAELKVKQMLLGAGVAEVFLKPFDDDVFDRIYKLSCY